MVTLLFRLVGFVVLLLMAVYLNEIVARKRDAKRYPMPDKLIKVGNHRLHLYAMGEGSPTIVLDAGLGESSLTWSSIQSEIAQFSRVCSYDRAGYGWSEPGPSPRTYPQLVEELHTLLLNAGETAPYVLVGHSAGGFTARLFAQRYPRAVAGLVLVDPSHEKDEAWSTVENRQKMMSALRAEIVPAAMGLYRLLARPAWKRMKPGAPAMMLAYAPFLASAKSIRASVDEMKHWPDPTFFDEVAQSPSSLGNLPLIVITATKDPRGADQEKVAQWIARHAELAKLSTNGKQILAACGHHVLHEQPGLVVSAVRAVVQQAREAMTAG